MVHDYPLITTIVASVVGAFIFGYIAKRLRLPTILGYLVAGIVIGPHTPGYVAHADIAKQLADIGIILLMFGVGMHFSSKDLLRVHRTAVPGALLRIVIVTTLGAGFTSLFGYNALSGIVFGVALSAASTVVVLRMFEQRHVLETDVGRLAIGWLVMEDLAMVLAIVLLPALGHMVHAPGGINLVTIITQISWVILKIAIFTAAMVFVGKRLLPPLLVRIAKTKSRELASLGTLSVALGFAYIAFAVFDASYALGAFLAGFILNESEIGHKAAEQSLPLRDTFAVLFFVSAGMLFDPSSLLKEPWLLLATVSIIIVGKALITWLLLRLLGQSNATSMTLGVSLAQIGEFSFIFAGLGLSLGFLPENLYNLVLAGAIISIAVNPFLFKALGRYTTPAVQ
jgi:CPA2 family monovalent cation:H+ antiporter-2